MSKLREEWNHQYTVHHTGCASISDQTEMQTHFCKLVCASFPCWVDFSAAICVDCNWLQSKAVPKSSVKAGGRKCRLGCQERKKGKSCEICDIVCGVWGWKGISCIGHRSGPSGCTDSGCELQLCAVRMRRWRDAVRRGGAGKRARGSHLGRGDHLHESSPQRPESKDKRGSGASGRPSYSPWRGAPRESVLSGVEVGWGRGWI